MLLLPVFEQFLDMAPDTSAHDTIRQSVIILMGCLARHLDKDDPKVEFSCKTIHLLISFPLIAVKIGLYFEQDWFKFNIILLTK